MGWITLEDGRVIHTSQFKIPGAENTPKEGKYSIQFFNRWASFDELMDIAANWVAIEDALEDLESPIDYENLITGAPNMVAKVLEAVNTAFGRNSPNEFT